MQSVICAVLIGVYIFHFPNTCNIINCLKAYIFQVYKSYEGRPESFKTVFIKTKP